MTEPTDFVYRATVVQYAPTDGPDYLWANTHEFTAPAGLLGDQTNVRAVALAFASYHRSLLNPRYGVDRVVLSTYGPDLPFPPGFASESFRFQGNGTAFGPPLPLSVVLYVRRNVTRGRDGKLFLRGYFSEGMIDGEELREAGSPTLRVYIRERGAELLNALSALDCQLVLASGPIAALQTRPVLSLEAVNARTLQYRTRRKTRLQQNALGQIASAFADGSLSPEEIPQVLDGLRRLLPTGNWPVLEG